MFGQALEIKSGHEHTAAIRMRPRQRQSEWQKAGTDTWQSREPARGEALGGDRIADPLWLIAGR